MHKLSAKYVYLMPSTYFLVTPTLKLAAYLPCMPVFAIYPASIHAMINDIEHILILIF